MSFTRGEDPNCVVMGFVLTQGQGQPAGAILCMGSSPTIAHCLIVGNRSTSTDGAAVYCGDSEAVLVNCTIADNYGGEGGAGLHIIDSNVVIVNSILWDNEANEILLNDDSALMIEYTDVAGGWPSVGNMDAEPLFARRGHWGDPDRADGTLEPSVLGAIWIAGDYHLKSQGGRWVPETQAWVCDKVTSPGIDAGDPLDSPGPETLPNGGIINIGGYGGTSQTSRSY